MTAVAFQTRPDADVPFVDIPLPDLARPPLFTVDDKGRVWGADGYQRGACGYCLHRSMRLYGGRLANHAEFRWRWRWFGWRWVRMLTPATGRCPGSGEPPRYERRAET